MPNSARENNIDGGDAVPEYIPYETGQDADLQHTDMEVSLMDSIASHHPAIGGCAGCDGKICGCDCATTGGCAECGGSKGGEVDVSGSEDEQHEAQSVIESVIDPVTEAEGSEAVGETDVVGVSGGGVEDEEDAVSNVEQFEDPLLNGGAALGGAMYCINTNNYMQVIMIVVLILLCVLLFHIVFMRNDVLKTPQTEMPVLIYDM